MTDSDAMLRKVVEAYSLPVTGPFTEALREASDFLRKEDQEIAIARLIRETVDTFVEADGAIYTFEAMSREVARILQDGGYLK